MTLRKISLVTAICLTIQVGWMLFERFRFIYPLPRFTDVLRIMLWLPLAGFFFFVWKKQKDEGRP